MKIKHILSVLLFYFSFLSGELIAQPVASLNKGTNLLDGINWLSETYDLNIFFNPDIFEGLTIEKQVISEDPITLLKGLIDEDIFKIKISEFGVTVVKKKLSYYNIYGYVEQQNSLIALPYANIAIKNHKIYTTSNDAGHYTLIAPQGDLEVTVSYLGHIDTTIQIHLDKDINLTLPLTPSNELSEVIIQESNQDDYQLNRYEYRSEKLATLSKSTPGLGGNNDLLHTTRSIAGIKSGGGGIGGYFIRGGNNAQNLFLLDGVSIYNPFHSLGLTSIFTPETTKSLQVYKSGFRAQHGDKSSGVLDIQLKEGDLSNYSAQIELNTQDGAIMIEGPIIKNHTSLFLSGRSTSISGPFNRIVTDAIYGDVEADNNTSYYDIIAKLKSRINDKNHLLATYYLGSDNIIGEVEQEEVSFENEQLLNWGNQLLSINWLSQLSSHSFLNTRASLNRYHADYFTLYRWSEDDLFPEELFYAETQSFNRDVQIESKVDLSLSPYLSISTGVNYLQKTYSPMNTFLTDESEELENESIEGIESISLEDEENELKTYKVTHFAEINWEGDKNKFQIGLRSNRYQFDDYTSVDVLPRINYSHIFNKKNALHLSISNTVQYEKLISSSDIFLPQDFWHPSSHNLVPETGWHYNIAYRYKPNNILSLNFDLYHKRVQNVNQSSLYPIDNSVDILGFYTIQGLLRSNGFELSAELDHEAFLLNVAYSFSKTSLQYEELNLGYTYPSQFDRQHELKLLSSILLSTRLKLGLTISMSTGHPLLLTDIIDQEVGLTPIDLDPVGFKNTTRTDIHHRVDFSVLYQLPSNKINHKIKFNLYNTYGVDQPLYYTYEEVDDDFFIKPNFSLPIIPSLSYAIIF